MLAPHSPLEQFRESVKLPPAWYEGGNWAFPLGTDALGRDMLSRIMHGARYSLFIGLSVMAVSIVCGVGLGLLAAFAGGWVDSAISRIMDLIVAIPSLVLAILIIAILQNPSLEKTIVAVTIVSLPRYVRLVRASALSEMGKDYVTAAKVAGVGNMRLMLRTVLPNCLAPVIVQAALGVSDAILEAAALGFLGLGAQPPTPEWGAMVGDGREFIRSRALDRDAPWPCDPRHRHLDQSLRRRASRRARSQAEAKLSASAFNRPVLSSETEACEIQAAARNPMSLLSIRNLTVSFATRSGAFTAVEAFDLSIERDEVVAIVGESGSGKSVAMLAVMGLLPWTATVTADELRFGDVDLSTLGPRERRAIIGRDITMIFQEPMSSLNPCFTVGFQLSEALKAHLDIDKAARRARCIELLDEVGITDPARRLSAFPHQLSGGMSQRVMIAMALACRPKLLIADEPTTALDVTIQAQILDLLRRLKDETGMGLIIITHDMGVVAETADRVIVQYAGEQVEKQSTRDLFREPRHPYTAALLAALPERAAGGERLAGDPRRRAGPIRPARRMPVLAALPIRLRALPDRAAGSRERRARARRAATRRSSRGKPVARTERVA